MRNIPLSTDPNQSLSVRLDDARYVLRIFSAAGGMCVDVDRDDVPLLRASRVLAGEPLLPFAWMQEGNFLLLTTGNEIPTYTEFGASQTLVYMSAAEIEAL